MTSPPRTFRVEILTQDYGLLPVEATGLPCAIQAARVVVTGQGDSRSHVVARAADSPWQLPEDDELIWRVFPDDFVSCVRSEVPGGATLSCQVADESTMCAAAAAAATLKKSWGWDESPTIRVQFAEVDTVLMVEPFVKDGICFATIASP